MTIATQSALAGPFTGNGSTTVFSFSFKCFSQADLQVIREESDVQTVLTITTDYTVTLNADQEASPGGNVTMVTAPTATQTVFIVSDVDYTQEAAFTNAGGFYPTVLNDARDRTTLQIQQLNDKIARALLAPVGTSGGYFGAPENIPIVAGISDEITALYAIRADIEDVADIDAETIVVAGIAANVTTVATNISDINSVVTNLSTYQTAVTNLSTYQTANTNFSVLNTVNNNTAAILAAATTATDKASEASGYADDAAEDAEALAAFTGVNDTSQRWYLLRRQIVFGLSGQDRTAISATYLDGSRNEYGTAYELDATI